MRRPDRWGRRRARGRRPYLGPPRPVLQRVGNLFRGAGRVGRCRPWRAASAPSPHSATTTVGEFKIALDTAKLAAGQETLSIKNDGKITHEFVVARTDLAAGALPIGADGGVDEEATEVTHIDEVEDIAAGSTGSLTVSLAAGRYVVFCNLPGHDRGGMHAAIDVTAGS